MSAADWANVLAALALALALLSWLRARKADKRADEAHREAMKTARLNRVRFQYDSSEVHKGLLRGAVIVRLLHVGTDRAEAVAFDADSLTNWSLPLGVHLPGLDPGERAELVIYRDRSGRLPEALTLTWDAAERGQTRERQVCALPHELSAPPDSTGPESTQ